MNRRENHDVNHEDELELEEGMIPMAGDSLESVTDDGKVEVLGRVEGYEFSSHTFRHEEDEDESTEGVGGELDEKNTEETDSDGLDSLGEV
ncbi:MAG: hypothetical protein M1835_000394 [Candelina submexicana]|nr:MAG: hypothetical protein M1835_000394 [Candelina submexicana]